MSDTLEIKCPAHPYDISRVVLNGEAFDCTGVTRLVFEILPNGKPTLTLERGFDGGESLSVPVEEAT